MLRQFVRSPYVTRRFTSTSFTQTKVSSPQNAPAEFKEKVSHSENYNDEQKAQMASDSHRTNSEEAVKSEHHDKSPDQLMKEGAGVGDKTKAPNRAGGKEDNERA